MPTYGRRERTTTRIEFVVPADPAYGASWIEVIGAVHAAQAEMRGTGLLRVDEEAAYDAIWVLPGDDAVIVYYEREVTP